MSDSTAHHPFRIAIVGGGIGGLYCALAIHHHCSKINTNFQIDVYEQASEYKEIGAGIGCRPGTSQLIHNIGLGDRLNAIGGSSQLLCCRRFDNSGEIITIPHSDERGVRLAPCARSELLDILKEAIEDRGAARLWTGKACVRVEDLHNHVRIHFADSTTASADFLIGADGIHSQVRRQFVSDKAHFSGCIAYRGVVPISSLPPWHFPSYNVAWLAKHRHFMVYAISADKKLNVVAFVTKTESQAAGTKESWTSTCDRKEVEADFEGFDSCVQGIIKLLPEEVPRWRINEYQPLDLWHYFNGKVVLLGDAAHAMTPHLGAGGGAAISDGWALGRALSEYLSSSSEVLTTVEKVAEVYQAARLPEAHRIQAMSRENGHSSEMQTPEMMGKSYDECCAMFSEGFRRRLKMSLGDETDALYEKAKEAMAVWCD